MFKLVCQPSHLASQHSLCSSHILAYSIFSWSMHHFFVTESVFTSVHRVLVCSKHFPCCLHRHTNITYYSSHTPATDILHPALSLHLLAYETIYPQLLLKAFDIPVIITNRCANLSMIQMNESSQAPTTTTLKMALSNVRSLSNKTLILNDFISDANLDFMFLT